MSVLSTWLGCLGVLKTPASLPLKWPWYTWQSTEGLCSSPTTSRSSQAKTLFLGTDHSGYILLKLALGMCLWL